MIRARKINKISEFYTIFPRNIPEFYMIFARKKYFRHILRGACPPPCPTYAYDGDVVNVRGPALPLMSLYLILEALICMDSCFRFSPRRRPTQQRSQIRPVSRLSYKFRPVQHKCRLIFGLAGSFPAMAAA